MNYKFKKPTMSDLLDLKATYSPMAETDLLTVPVALHTYYKRKTDYLYITKVVQQVRDMTFVEGYVLTVDQYRNIMIDRLIE